MRDTAAIAVREPAPLPLPDRSPAASARPLATGGLGLALIPPLLLGAILRTYHLDRQIPGGDELHALRSLLEMSWQELLTTYRETDYCQPLTILYRLLANTGLELHELWLRLPVVVSSIALTGLAPLAVRRLVPRSSVIAFAWILALSPPLVLYGRLIRGYAPATLLCFLAIVSFYRWWRRPSFAWGLAYALPAALAIAFHLLSSPLLAAPFLFAVGWRVAGRNGPRWRDLVLLGLAAGAAVASFVLPAWPSLVALLALKQQTSTLPSPAALMAVARLQSGTGSSSAALVFVAVAALGAGRLLRRERPLALLLACGATTQAVALVVLAPTAIGVPLVLNRYLLFLTPFGALCAALGLTGGMGDKPGKRWLPIAVALALWTAVGPWRDGAVRRADFLGHNLVMAYDARRPVLRVGEVPTIYRRLAAGEFPGPILELPLGHAWRDSEILPLYQDLHRRSVLAASPSGGLRRGALNLRRLLPPRLDRLLASEARLLIVHRRMSEEQADMLDGTRPQRKGRVSSWAAIDRAGRQAEGNARRAWGPPDLNDEWVAVWDIERVRRQAENDGK